MKQIRNFIVAAALVLASGLHAAPAVKRTPYDPIIIMINYGKMGIITVDLTMSGNQAANADPTLLDAIKAQFSPSLKASAHHPALQNAVKDYYAAALALFGNLDPQGDERVIVYQSRIGSLETALKQAQARVSTELAALGVED